MNKVISSTVIIVFLLSTTIFAKKSIFIDDKIGVVGCSIINADTTIHSKEVEAHVVQRVVSLLQEKKKFASAIIDRTTLMKVVEEYTLTLSGLIESKGEEEELNILATDYLLLSTITGLTTSVEEVLDEESMGDSPQLFRGRVQYRLSFELVSSTKGDIVWSYSKKCVNAHYYRQKEEVHIREVLFQSLDNSVKEALISLYSFSKK